MANLCWHDVDPPKQAHSSLRRMVTRSRKSRGVPLPRRSDALLRNLHEQRPEDEGHVFFVQTVGCKWRKTAPQAKPFFDPHGAWASAVKRAGLQDLRLHDLRHAYASRLVQRGVPLLTLSQLLGHSTIKMTMRYSHLASEDLRSAVDRLDQNGTADIKAERH